MKHATIVPLIGGATIGQSRALGRSPEWVASYSPFKDNDQHLLNYLNNHHELDVPFYTLDSNEQPTEWVDIINTVCPCAGLSMLNNQNDANRASNDWMYATAEYVLSDLKPTWFWGENAPNLASPKGEAVRDKLQQIAYKHSYQFYVFKCNAVDHGLGQRRPRAIYLFTNEKAPEELITRPRVDVRDVIRSASSHNEMFEDHTEPFAHSHYATPEDDGFLMYLQVNGIAHTGRRLSIQNCSRNQRDDWDDIIEWLDLNGYEADRNFAESVRDKILAGKNIFRRGTMMVSSGEIQALVGSQNYVEHPDENRYLNYRELLTLMGMPTDFQLVNPKKNVNHISQNVPVNVAEDFVRSIVS